MPSPPPRIPLVCRCLIGPFGQRKGNRARQLEQSLTQFQERDRIEIRCTAACTLYYAQRREESCIEWSARESAAMAASAVIEQCRCTPAWMDRCPTQQSNLQQYLLYTRRPPKSTALVSPSQLAALAYWKRIASMPLCFTPPAFLAYSVPSSIMFWRGFERFDCAFEVCMTEGSDPVLSVVVIRPSHPSRPDKGGNRKLRLDGR